MRNHERGARFQSDRERLALVDEPADDDAIDRRADHGAVEIGLGRSENGRLLRHGHSRLLQFRLDPADIGLRAID